MGFFYCILCNNCFLCILLKTTIMRRIYFLLCTLSFSFHSIAQKESLQVSSKIEKVTVFLQGAQVERTAQQSLKPGKYNIVFGSVSPKIEKQSIQLKADGKLIVLSVTHQVNHLKEQQVQAEIKQLETQKELWANKITAEKNLKNVYTQEEQLIIKNQEIKGDATLKAQELREAADFQRQRLTELYQKLQETDHNLLKMETEMKKTESQLVGLNQKKDLSTSDIIVTLDVKENTAASFRLAYLVKQSSWFPTYDVRVTDISKPINFLMKANISQQSGEDWNDVKLFLSTGNPNENGTKPDLSPWHLRYNYQGHPNVLQLRGMNSINNSNTVTGVIQDEKGLPVVGATIMVKGTNTATVSDASGIFRIQMTQGLGTLTISSVGYESQEISASSGYAKISLKAQAHALQEVVVTAFGSTGESIYEASGGSYKRKKDETAIATSTIYQPTTTVFEIESPYSVPDDGKNYTVDINNYELTALYEYYSVPKLDQSAYLTTKVIDWQDLNLLPGEANLFFEGTYLGNSFLDVASAGDTLNISLGKDKGVIVKRTLLKEYSSRKFLGSNRTDTRNYEISVRNNKQQPIKITIEDQLPISTSKEIDVDKLSYKGGKLDDETNKVTWSIELESKKENKVQLGYAVKYPKDKTLLLD
jgi:hypothetical protein